MKEVKVVQGRGPVVFGTALYQAYSKRGLTQKQLAAKVGVQQPRISMYVAGMISPSGEVQDRILKLFPELVWCVSKPTVHAKPQGMLGGNATARVGKFGKTTVTAPRVKPTYVKDEVYKVRAARQYAQGASTWTEYCGRLDGFLANGATS